jgi:hypothetical protein
MFEAVFKLGERRPGVIVPILDPAGSIGLFFEEFAGIKKILRNRSAPPARQSIPRQHRSAPRPSPSPTPNLLSPKASNQKAFETTSRLPRRQQQKVAEFVEAFVNQHSSAGERTNAH